MQGRNENLLTCSDKLNEFRQKLELWQTELRRESQEMYQRTNQTTIENKQIILDLAQKYLTLLQQKFEHFNFTQLIRNNMI